MVGILVHGINHFILSGPLPDEATALALVRYWSIIQIGETKSLSFGQWQIIPVLRATLALSVDCRVLVVNTGAQD